MAAYKSPVDQMEDTLHPGGDVNPVFPDVELATPNVVFGQQQERGADAPKLSEGDSIRLASGYVAVETVARDEVLPPVLQTDVAERLRQWREAERKDKSAAFIEVLQAFAALRGDSVLTDLARAMGMHYSTVWRWANAHTKTSVAMQGRVVRWIQRRI